ncbi:sugar ABC transporter substrate-binding protein [Schumannella soli]|uniref:Sugar ABC transporter substrate-binding protein n=1 Tax=Schumannella soli TaxID=2590779 RepID=A0A506XNK3_9MICO|nr:sugar ABC transporter substrate-binding protein [Schumannella soli]TPW74244.1 sugar ABC transporter substrate-binding protein [Schumannella soli]
MKRRHTPVRTAAAGISLLLAVAVTLTGCSNGTTGSTDHKYVIGVAEASTQIPFLAKLDESITKRAAKYGIETVILDGAFDNAKQAANVTTLAGRKVDALLVISSSPTSVVGPINAASKKGIPVFAVNSRLDDKADVITYVGASNFDYGVAQGKLLLKALPDGGKIAVILGPLGNPAQVDRLAGLEKVLKSHPEFEIVAKPSDEFDNAKNLSVTQDLLNKYPEGELDAIVAQGPQMYVGANYAVKQGRTDVKIIAADYPKQIEEAITSGAIYGTVDQNPKTQGEIAADYAYYWLTGKKDKVKKPEFITPLPLVTKETVATYSSVWSF